MRVLTRIRRYILHYVVPEFVWPSEITLDGIRFRLRGTPYSFGIKYLLSRRANEYELPERILLQYIHPGDTVLELGGSIGIVTRCIAEKVGPTGKVLTVEASENLTSFSRKWLEKLPNTTVVTAFAFPVHHKIQVSFQFDESRGSLGGTVIFTSDTEPGRNKKVFFIESAEEEYGICPNVLVCDIEGSEVMLLHEKAMLPHYLNTIIMEFHPGIYSPNVTLKIIERIQHLGYTLVTSLHSVYVFKRGTLDV